FVRVGGDDRIRPQRRIVDRGPTQRPADRNHAGAGVRSGGQGWLAVGIGQPGVGTLPQDLGAWLPDRLSGRATVTISQIGLRTLITLAAINLAARLGWLRRLLSRRLILGDLLLVRRLLLVLGLMLLNR